MTKPKTGKSSVKKVRKPKEKIAQITINPRDLGKPLSEAGEANLKHFNNHVLKDQPTNEQRFKRWHEFVKVEDDADFSEEERKDAPSLSNTVLALAVLGVIVYVVHHLVNAVL